MSSPKGSRWLNKLDSVRNRAETRLREQGLLVTSQTFDQMAALSFLRMIDSLVLVRGAFSTGWALQDDMTRISNRRGCNPLLLVTVQFLRASRAQPPIGGPVSRYSLFPEIYVRESDFCAQEPRRAFRT